METETMGRVLTAATIENLEDLWAVKRGLLAPEQARQVALADALVDTGATLLSLPTRLIQELGLSKTSSKRVTSSIGLAEAGVYDAVRLIQGRTCTMDVMEVPDTVPVRIGQLPLVHLDLVVDPRTCSLIGNPAHGGEHVYELYSHANEKPEPYPTDTAGCPRNGRGAEPCGEGGAVCRLAGAASRLHFGRSVDARLLLGAPGNRRRHRKMWLQRATRGGRRGRDRLRR